MIKIIKTCLFLLIIGGLGAFFIRTPAGHLFEEEVGLNWLFQLRGTLPPPADVIIVSIDQVSALKLGLSEEPKKWPRTHYATLIDKLRQQHPAIIAFDIHFSESYEPEKDAVFAKAIIHDKNIILASVVKRFFASVPQSPTNAEMQNVRLIEPTPLLAKASLSTAAFPLPKTASTVKQYWLYASDRPTLPLCIFQYFVVKEAYAELMQLLKQIEPTAFLKLPGTVDRFFHESSELVDDIQMSLAVSSDQLQQRIVGSHYSVKVKQLLASWLTLLQHQDRLYLNFYGDIGAITTIPFYQALTPEKLEANLFKNKIVLVGYSDNLEPEKQQGFYSAFSKASGQVISPTEIVATAVANFIDQSWLNQLPNHLEAALVLVWGVILSGMFRFFLYRYALLLSFVFVAIYIVFAGFMFTTKYIWLPFAIPMLQVVVVLALESGRYYRKIRKVTSYYLPKEVFKMNLHNSNMMSEYGIHMQGICMATDAGQYTSLSEFVNPLQLHKVMNDYYAAIFPLVKKHGGLISDVIGDAMLAVWAAPKIDNKLRVNANHAALAIKAAIDGFNAQSDYSLDTRIGLHYGEMRLGNIGAADHFEYRAVGDTVNTATRIEGLNKLLGTRILASAEVVEGLSRFTFRELGTFLLKGKKIPITIFELTDNPVAIENVSSEYLLLLAKFGQALKLFKANRWQEALALFIEINKSYPGDGPTCFYISYLQYQTTLPDLALNFSKEHAGIIDVGNITAWLQ